MCVEEWMWPPMWSESRTSIIAILSEGVMVVVVEEEEGRSRDRRSRGVMRWREEMLMVDIA